MASLTRGRSRCRAGSAAIVSYMSVPFKLLVGVSEALAHIIFPEY